MKKYIFFFLFLFLFPCTVFAKDTSKASIVMDVDSGRILYRNNIHEKRLIASITKIMTATIVLENTDLHQKFMADSEVLKMYGTNIYIELGESMSVEDLLYGLMLRSGNDAAVVLARGVSSSEEEFVKLMNEKAKSLGMDHTIFRNSHGLDEETENYSTAYDMALLSKYIYQKSSFYRKMIKTYKYTSETDKKSYLWYNRNKLLTQYKYCVGGKTGYTPRAGRTLVSVAKKNGMTLTAVSLKDSNHYESQEDLYESMFAKYKRYQIIDPDHFSLDEEYYKDQLYIKEGFYYPLSDEELSQIKTVVKITKLKNYQDQDKVGEIEITFKNEVIKKIDVFVHKEKKKGFFSSLFHS